MDIAITHSNQVMTIAFNRPHKKHAITAAMYQMLADALYQADADEGVRAILIHGSEDAFSAGNDLTDFLEHPPLEPDAPVFHFLKALRESSKPIVAAVSGMAVGVGVTLLLHCDLVYAADNAVFSMPFARLGLCPEAASSLLLPQAAGFQRAAEALLLGEPFDAAAAVQMGFVCRLVPLSELFTFAAAQTAKLAALPLQSVRMTKALMKRPMAAQVAEQMDKESQEFRKMLVSAEARAVMQAFFNKKKVHD